LSTAAASDSASAAGTVGSRAPGPREDQAEGRALAEFARDVELAAVTLHHVLDDRQPEAGAARFARPAAVDPIEASVRRDRCSRAMPRPVSVTNTARAVVVALPADLDPPPSGV
jgi:hypothetical protein